MKVSKELIEQFDSMKVGNANTLDEKVLLLIFSYELYLKTLK